MKLWVLLMSACCLCRGTEADARSYLITAPLSLRLDAMETIVLQLFGFTDEVRVYVFLKTSMAPNHVVLAQEVVTLNSQNHHQGSASVRLNPAQVKNMNEVILHIQSNEINKHQAVPISRTNGFLFIQTDKPLYTPRQSVKVRAFSLNQELRPANRSVFLTFKDPDQTTVDIVEMYDFNNGIPSMQNPFKIPIKPKLGIWTIEASYSSDYTTKARTDFQVKEYVLPSISIVVEPQTNYISYEQFQLFSFKVTAKYLHGAPVDGGEVYLRYGYVSGDSPPVIIPTSVTRQRLSPNGERMMTLNMEKVLSKHDGPRSLDGLLGKYLYITVLLQEASGGITQEMEFASVKFVKSPYSLSLVSTPPFIKPGLPYSIQVLVKDHLDKPLSRVPVTLVVQRLFKQGGQDVGPPCPDSFTTTQSNGIAIFICNMPALAERAELKFETEDPGLPQASQASLDLNPVAYHSANHRYLYIDPPMTSHALQVGQFSSIKVYSATPSYIPVKALSYLVLSKGKVVHFNSQKFVSSIDNRHTLSFEVTAAMVPSIRVLVYYILYGEGTPELVADSVWMDVKHNCVNGLQTDLSFRSGMYKPQDNIQLNVKTNRDGLVALSAVDTGVFAIRPNYKDPVSMVLRHIEHSDQGCGGGGGKNNADVFRLAGLTFMTNANAQSLSLDEVCTAKVRPRRALSDEQKRNKAKTYGILEECCEQGMRFIPKGLSCRKFAYQCHRKAPLCRQAFRECCEFILEDLHINGIVLGRNELGADFNQVPSLVRSYFPESWLWEVQPVSAPSWSESRKLPDSLTTWEIKAVGMFRDGICVSTPAEVSVNLRLSLDIPLPYQVIRGEQVTLKGSVYNKQDDGITYCVTLTVGPELCLLRSLSAGQGGRHSSPCIWSSLSENDVAAVSFTVLALQPGEHTLTFVLETRDGTRDTLVKKLVVVPEGVLKERFSGGRLDPQGLYGSEKRIVELKNVVPYNIVPNTVLERELTINGEILGDVLSVVHKPDAFRKIINLPAGSAESALVGILPLAQVYHYLETTSGWKLLGEDIFKNAAELRKRIREGLVGVSSFRRTDSSYSLWLKRESSTWLTAMVVKTLSLVDSVVLVDHQSLSQSLTWLIRENQKPDGSFTDKSAFKPNKVVAGMNADEHAVFLTSFVLIAMHRATRIRDPILQLQFHDASMRSAANFIAQRTPAVKSVYARAMATYALTLHDPSSIASSTLFSSMEGLARQKGNPAELRYWQEAGGMNEYLKPDETSGVTVETTAYALLTVLKKGRIPYANPILSWLTQDQHYGQGFYSLQDIVLTLEALTEYSKTVPRAVLNQEINIRSRRAGTVERVELTQSRPVARPIKVMAYDDITVSTGYSKGVSNVKMKMVYYETVVSDEMCNFDLTVEVSGPDQANGLMSPQLVACAKYNTPPNELLTESTLTVMEIQLQTGVDAYLDDLKQFMDLDEPIISHYELQGNNVVIQMDTVPSEDFLCVAFRIKTSFLVSGSGQSLMKVYESQDRGSICTKQFSYQEQVLQPLCVGEECQCMAAACATYRGEIDSTLTTATRLAEVCHPDIKYAYRVTVESSVTEGDFITYTATVAEVLRKKDKVFEGVSAHTPVELVKKVTCNRVKIQLNEQYLVMGASGSEVLLSNSLKYRLPLDSEALVELWPTSCSSPACLDYVSHLNDLSVELQLFDCPNK